MREEFRDIKREGFECYKVSNMGNIILSSNGEPAKLQITKSGKCKNITQTVSMKNSITKKTVNVSVPRLVAEAFMNNFDKNMYVKHIDKNPLNNNISNLYLSVSVRDKDAYRNKNIIKIQQIHKSSQSSDSTLVVENAINALKNLQKLMKDIETCKENIVAYDKFSQDILHDIEMLDMDDENLLTKAKMIKEVRNKRRYNKNVEIVSDFINKQLTNAGLSSGKIDIMVSKLQNAKAKLEATENGKAYNRRFDELNDYQKQVIENELLSMFM